MGVFDLLKFNKNKVKKESIIILCYLFCYIKDRDMLVIES